MIEEIGVSLSKKMLEQSDLVLFIADGLSFSQEDEQVLNLIKDKNHLFVINKTDCSNFTDDRADLYISAKEKSNIDTLRDAIYNKTVGLGIDLNGDFLCEERHNQALLRSQEKLQSALLNVSSVPLDLLAIDIKDGWDALGEISGRTATEDIINNIFSKFCVGK
jgi:tRNA modification GTPase